MHTSLPRLGFAGIGLMGLPMCQRLLAAGYPLTVWNRSPEKCAPLVALGAVQVFECAELCDHADIIMLCLADTQAVQRVMFADYGIGFAVKRNRDIIIIDFSSIEPAATVDMAERLDAIGGRWLDVPVSGGVAGAQAGNLVMMAGGDAQALAQVLPVLEHLSQRVTHMGQVGSGQVAKVCNQMLVACNAMVIAEVVALAEQAGVDAALLAPALAGGFADSTPLQILAPQMAKRAFEPVKWHVRTLLKDLDMAVKLSQQHTSATPMSGLAAQLMRSHGAQGHLASDPATLIKLYSGGN
ncbi:NAD(P)-dependent oxidoreductase [Pseudomonas sp. C27(2019)]|uniref:NAD(P)-dependent oxidoreductase n=1 Tax=Pseudomonas sp. C27(2019) TaxID=2604941 RepID=UPI00124842AD|nr:NAD(P)-dependent oxidoreductase [Pseudomonas sp. C27(2019)]QEY58878.1 NAD(P)-dependent oxidoreductase [Pseudomonas sp. C27(2019)]